MVYISARNVQKAKIKLEINRQGEHMRSNSSCSGRLPANISQKAEGMLFPPISRKEKLLRRLRRSAVSFLSLPWMCICRSGRGRKFISSASSRSIERENSHTHNAHAGFFLLMEPKSSSAAAAFSQLDSLF